jgi:glycosyltransferase involved in cell wall biosynthesis
MRILEINTEQYWRGGEKQTLLTTEGLLQKSHDVVLLCKKNSTLHQKAISRAIPYVSISSNIDLFFYLIINARKFDIIHTHTAKSLTPCILSRFTHNTKVVFSRRHHKIPSSFFSKWKYNAADFITTVSQYIKKRLVDGGISAPVKVIHDASIFVVPNPIRIQHHYNKYLRLGKKIIATVAAFEHEKDPHTLLAAIEALSKVRTDFIFLHFGSGSLEYEISQEITHRNLGSVYYCLGQTNSIEELYSMFDVFVISSKNEGFGSSVIDAFLNNVPVVSTDAGGLKELVEGRGYLAETGNPQCLCEQINKCLSSDSSEQIKKAYLFASTELSTDTIQTQYEELFTRLTNPTVHPA